MYTYYLTRTLCCIEFCHTTQGMTSFCKIHACSCVAQCNILMMFIYKSWPPPRYEGSWQIFVPHAEC